jgi:phospholipase C
MQDEATALFVEPGFRRTVGMLTEGRYLVFQQTSSSGQDLGLTVTNTTSCSPTLTANLISSPVPLQKELNPSQRFIIHTSGFYPDFEYQIQSAFVNSTDSFFGSGLAFVEQTDAATFLIVDHMNGQGYSIQEKSSKKFVSIDSRGRVLLASSDYRFTVFAVTFAL